MKYCKYKMKASQKHFIRVELGINLENRQTYMRYA